MEDAPTNDSDQIALAAKLYRFKQAQTNGLLQQGFPARWRGSCDLREHDLYLFFLHDIGLMPVNPEPYPQILPDPATTAGFKSPRSIRKTATSPLASPILAWHLRQLRSLNPLSGQESHVRKVEQIAAFGEKAVRGLAAILTDTREEVYIRELAALGLSRIGGTLAAVALLECSDDLRLRLACIRALRKIEGEEAQRIRALVDDRLRTEAETLIVLVTKVIDAETAEKDGERRVYDAEGMVLSSARGVTVMLDGLPLWQINGDSAPLQVEASTLYLRGHASVQGVPAGKHVEMRKSKLVLVEELHPVIESARNWIRFALAIPGGPPPSDVKVPFLVSGKPNIGMYTHDVVVKLAIQTYSESADVTARATPPSPAALDFFPLTEFLAYSRLFLDRASAVRPVVGDWLPVAVADSGRNVVGALHLTTARGECDFAAELTLCDDLPIRKGTTLLRRVTWQSANLLVVEKVVGEVVDVDRGTAFVSG